MKSFFKISVIMALLFTLACSKVGNNTELPVLAQLRAQSSEFKIAEGHSSKSIKTIKVKSLAEAKKMLQDLQEFTKQNRAATAELRLKRELTKQAPPLSLYNRDILQTRHRDVTGICGGFFESGVISGLRFGVTMHCVEMSTGRQGGMSRLFEQFSVDDISYFTPTEVFYANNSLQITWEDNGGICGFGGDLLLTINLEIQDADDPNESSQYLVTFSFALEGYWNAQGGQGCHISYAG